MFNCQVAHQNCVYACPTPIQEAVARAFELELKRLESPECYFKSISVDLQQRRDMIVSILEEAGIPPVVPEVKYIPSSCTYFTCLVMLTIQIFVCRFRVATLSWLIGHL